MEHVVSASNAQGAVYCGRHGYHACDYRHYLLLRKVWKAVYRLHREWKCHHRWARKDPQNRVLRQCVRNEKGQKIGEKVVGQIPEPYVTPQLGEAYAALAVQDWRGWAFRLFGQNIGWGRSAAHVTRPSCMLRDILAEYQNARRPQATPEAVKPGKLTYAQLLILAKTLGVEV